MGDEVANELTLAAQLEGILFVAAEPVGLTELGEALGIGEDEIELGLADLELGLSSRGVRLQRHGGRVQLTTAPGLALPIERFLGLEARTHLTRAAMETLAIVAYHQPVTRPQIEEIRGVNSDTMLKSLMLRGLVEELGRAQGPGRPILYQTTPEFLQHFGLAAIENLPPLAQADSPESPEPLLKG